MKRTIKDALYPKTDYLEAEYYEHDTYVGRDPHFMWLDTHEQGEESVQIALDAGGAIELRDALNDFIDFAADNDF